MSNVEGRSLPLDDLVVLDLSRYGPGLIAGMILGDMGAEVIHLEEPVASLPANRVVALDDRQRGERELPGYAANRNKRSIVVDLKAPAGVEVAHRLLKRADVVLEGFRPGVADRLGIGYEAARQINPGVIYCSISGYGQQGPYARRAGHDLNYVALAGVLSRTRSRAGEPVVLGVQAGDFAGGTLHALVGILTAVHHRQRTGQGQFIDAAMVDGVLALMTNTFSRHFLGLEPGDSEPVVLTGASPFYNVYPTSDGAWVSIGCVETHLWNNLCELLDRPDLVAAYADQGRWPEAIDELTTVFAGRPLAVWRELLDDANVAFAAVNDVADVAGDPHLIDRGSVWDGVDEDGAPIRQLAPSLRLSETPGTVRRLAPTRGEHTAEILAECGYDDESVDRLMGHGVVAGHGRSAVGR